MKKTALLFLIIFIFVNTVFSQSKKNKYFLNKVEFGTSVTYIWDSPISDNYFFQELTWNVNGSISISKYMNIGIQSLVIFATSYIPPDTANYNIVGVFSQFNVLNQKEVRIFGEVSLNKGDYCFCVKGNIYDEPYRKAGLNYIGYGFGIEMPIFKNNKHLIFEAGFHNFLILNRIKYKSNYTQYILGVNYVFGKMN